MSNIDRIIKHAVTTFSKNNKHYFHENFSNLVSMTNQLALNDVYLTKDFILKHDGKYNKRNPVIFVSIFKDLNVQVTIFILKSKSKITLHDHPLMHGILKVLSGKIQVQSYSTSEEYIKIADQSKESMTTITISSNDGNTSYYPYTISPLPVQKHESITISEKDECTVITPTTANFHEIVSVNGPSAFFDILAPPYTTPLFSNIESLRECTYFKERIDKSSIVLVPYYGNVDFWCAEMKYTGPPTIIQ